MKTRAVLLLAVILLGTFLVYLPSLQYPLIWDTRDFVRKSSLLNQPGPLFYAFSRSFVYGHLESEQNSMYYRPLVNFTFMLEKQLWGLQARTLRTVNLVLYLLLLLLFFLMLRGFLVPVNAALCATALFAFFPFNADNVIWVVSRCDLMMMFFGLLSLLFLQLRHSRQQKGYLICIWLSVALGLLSKETFVFFIFLLIAAELLYFKKISRVCHGINLALLILFWGLKTFVLRIAGLSVDFSLSWWQYPIQGLQVFGHYLQVLLVPWTANFFNFTAEVRTVGSLAAGTAGLLLFCAFFVLFIRKKNQNTWLLPLIMITVFMVPYIVLTFTSLWPFAISARYMMTAFAGTAWLACLALARCRPVFQILAITALLLLSVPSVLNHSRKYSSEAAYWQQALDSHPDHPVLLLKNAETLYMNRNDLAARALLCRLPLLDADPLTRTQSHLLRAKLEYERCDYTAARQWLNIPDIARQPQFDFQARLLRARMASARGDTETAATILTALTAAFPARREAYAELHRLYAGRTRWQQAAAVETRARDRINPNINWKTAEKMRALSAMSPAEKAGFFMRNGNFSAALSLMPETDTKTAPDTLMLKAWLSFRSGRSGQGTRIIRDMASGADCQRLNTLARFCLNRLKRPEMALEILQQSLKQEDRPQLRQLYKKLLRLNGSCSR